MSKKTLNTANLEALGAARLASLLIEVSTGSADIKRRLRLELSHNLGPEELARDLRKRLAQLRKSKSFVGWRKRKALVKDLETQAAMITDKIAPDDPVIGFDLMWEFIGLAPFIHARTDDSRGEIGAVFRMALETLEDLAPRALLDPQALADRVWTAIEDDGYGAWDGIISLMGPALGPNGLAHVKDRVEAYGQIPAEAPDAPHEAIAFLRQLRGGQNYAQERKTSQVRHWLQEIATAAGDTEGFVAQYSDADLRRRDIAAKVALLYLEEDQAQDALDLLRAVDDDGSDFGRAEWDTAYVATLLALGETDLAQAHRWTCFETYLDGDHLRAHLKLLPDFEDVEAEERAMAHARSFADVHTALAFLINWPDLRSAAMLVQERSDQLDGDHYMLLAPAADALRLRHPLAAVLLWRRMIDYALGQARATRYGHAADNLADCAALDAEIADYGGHVDHETYMADLRRRHERKVSFWSKLSYSVPPLT